jgi:hypothetical protein
MKAPSLKKIVSCKYCLDYKGDPKPIFPKDMKYAKRMEDGTYMCRVCIFEKLLKLNGIRNENERKR